VGTAEIREFDEIVRIYEPKKQVRPKIDLALIPTIEKEAIVEGTVFKDIADMDAVCHVVRAFKNDSTYHVDGSIDPRRDIDT
jgi:hypothetical protein